MTTKIFFKYSVFLALCFVCIGILSASQARAQTITDGDLIRADTDVYIVKIVGTKALKRLILNPLVFESYGHLQWESVKTVSNQTLNGYRTVNLVQVFQGDGKIFRLFPEGDTGVKSHIQLSAQQFQQAGGDWESVYFINEFERDLYRTITPITTTAQFVSGLRPDGVTAPQPSGVAQPNDPTTLIGYVQKLQQFPATHPDYQRLRQAMLNLYPLSSIQDAYERYFSDSDFANHRYTYACQSISRATCEEMSRYLSSEIQKLTSQEFGVVFQVFEGGNMNLANLTPNTPSFRLYRGLIDIFIDDTQFVATTCNAVQGATTTARDSIRELCKAFFNLFKETGNLTDQQYFDFWTNVSSGNWNTLLQRTPSLITNFKSVFVDTLQDLSCGNLVTREDCLATIEAVSQLSNQEFINLLNDPSRIRGLTQQEPTSTVFIYIDDSGLETPAELVSKKLDDGLSNDDLLAVD